LDFYVVNDGEMGLNIKLDLKNVYRVTLRDAEQRVCEFDTTLSAGEKMRLGVKISLDSPSGWQNLQFGLRAFKKGW